MIAVRVRAPVEVETGAHWRERSVATCRGCRWTRDDKGDSAWLAVRMAARRHVASTGHHVWVKVVQAYAYRPREGQKGSSS